MSPETGDIRRIDVGHGIYVHTGDDGGPDLNDESARRRVPRVAFAVGAVLAAAAIVRLGLTPSGVLAAAMLVVLAALAAVDMRARLLPNRIVLPATAVALCWQIAFFPGHWDEWVLAGLGAGAFLMLPGLIRPGAVGLGDVKLGVLLGVALGVAVVPALMLAFLLAAPAALVVLARRGPRATMPYGPFLALGAAIVLFAG
jgi:leader peptidase (prepilin peptidase)/N-methyltransferase